MFNLQPNPTFWATVSIPVPGEKEPAKIEILFRHKTRTGVDGFIKAARENTNETDGDVELLAGIINDWKGPDGEFSRENLTALLENYPASARAITRAYISSLLEGCQKN